MIIKYTKFVFQPLLMDEILYTSLKKENSPNYLIKLHQELKMEKKDFINKSGVFFHYFALICTILFVPMLLILPLAFSIFGFEQYLDIIFENIFFGILGVICIIGFFTGIFTLNSYYSFIFYQYNKKKWFKKLKKKIDKSKSYSDYQKIVNYPFSDFNYFRDGGYIPDE